VLRKDLANYYTYELQVGKFQEKKPYGRPWRKRMWKDTTESGPWGGGGGGGLKGIKR
jgi:hypothetical protein